MLLGVFALWSKLQLSVPTLFIYVVVSLIIKLEKTTPMKSMFLKKCTFFIVSSGFTPL